MSLKLIDNSSVVYTTHFTFHISLFLQGLLKVQTGEVVTVYDEGHPRGLWRLGRVVELIPSADGKVHGVRVKVVSKGGQIKIIQRPFQHIYPLEVRSSLEDTSAEEPHSSPVTESSSPVRTRSTRQAAAHARDRFVGVMMENEL